MARTSRGATPGNLTIGARYALAALAFVFGIGAVAQIFIAGLSLFESAEFWTDHVDLGRYLGIPALLIPVAALVGRVARPVLAVSVAVTLLYMLQMVLANVDNGYIGALHALNAIAVTGAAFQAGGRALALVRHGERLSEPYGAAPRGSD